MTVLTESRLRTAWQAAHDPVAGVPRWTRIVAYCVPFTVLPAGLWRIATCTFHLPIALGRADSGNLPWWLPLEVYVLLLSVLSELLAFTAVGLVAGWGEVFPRWIPGLRGRRVPVAAAVGPAAVGAGLLTAGTVVLVAIVPFSRAPFDYHRWQGVLAIACYAPLLLWGPLLAVLTVAYWRRRG